MELKPGSRWKSAVCTTEAVVVRPPRDAATLQCGGVAMAALGAAPAPAQADPALMAGSQLGKRYVDAESGVELLCIKTGEGSLSIDGRPVVIKDAKRLPSSD